MKKLLFLTVVAMAVFCSCSKDDADENEMVPKLSENSDITGYAEATVNGQAKEVKWVQLWENGPKFAEFNVGATSPTGYGGYYCWGNTDEQSSNWTGSYKDGNEPLSADDTATRLWGDNWRMPTKDEFQGLLDSCDVEIVENPDAKYKILGRKFKGKGEYSSVSVFFPAAGYCSSSGVRVQGSYGYYWTSSPDGSYYAYRLYFNSGNQYVGSIIRYNGYSVRAVLKE